MQNKPPITSASNRQVIPAFIAQLGERQTEDLKVPGSIPGEGNSTTMEQLHLVAIIAKSAVYIYTSSAPLIALKLFIHLRVL